MAKRPRDDAVTPASLLDAYNDPAQWQPADMAAFLAPLWRLNDAHLHRAPSRIPDAGLGLFTRDAIAAGTAVTWYSGAVVSYTRQREMQRADPRVKDYAWDLFSMRLVILGNYAYHAGTGALERVPYDQLDAMFTGDGAAQFCNSISPGAPGTGQNVAYITVKDARWNVPPDQDILNATDALVRRYPRGEGRATILFALEDIGAGEELVADYGAGYFASSAKQPRWRFPCATCGRVGAPLACDGCTTETLYCNRACQEADWAAHVIVCSCYPLS